MSEGNKRCEQIMAPLMMRGLDATVYNRIYEAVDALSDGAARRLVDAISEIVGEAGKDRERLDWLEARYGKSTRWNGPSLGEDWLNLMQYHEGGNMVLWDSVRAAIDAARQREGG